MDATVSARTLLLVAAVWAGAVNAAPTAGLPDPTRPPAMLLPGSADSVPGVPALPQLQSILIAPHLGGRHVAVIDGQTLRLGDKFQGAVLTKMTDTQVELTRGAKRQILTLYPARAVPAAAPTPAVATATPSR